MGRERSMRKKVQNFFRRIVDSGESVRAKIFILLTIIGMFSLILALIADIFLHENMGEISALLVTVLVAPLITYLAVKKNRIQLGASIMSVLVVGFVVPLVFCFGGGLTGGGVIWFVFAYLYIGIILVGTFRIVMMTLLTILIFALYIASFFVPELIVSHERFGWYLDSGVSILLVGFSVYYMVRTQYRLYVEESEKAKLQAKKIEEMNRAQSRFFSSMSHEIRTPINTIIGLNEMILRADVSEDVAENAANIQSASKILLSLINDILDMSKMESGKMEIVKVQYDVGKMLSEIVNMTWIKADEKGLKFSVYVDPSMPSQLFSDEVRIKQILLNLLNNAVKYTKEGSVSLSVHCVKTDAGKAIVTYSVEDTGIGIRKESIPHLFDAFRREDNEKNRYIEGTGLGLSIVKQLVDLLGGTISVNSVYTKGSTFVVSLEQEIADEKMMGEFGMRKLGQALDKPKYNRSFEAPEARILVVDDNATNLLVVKKLLKETKVIIDTAENASKCLNMTLQNRYNMIFMDHLMPGMDGIECLHALRDQAGGLCKDAPVVALTANAGSENQALYRREGFDEYLVKPIDSSELERTVLKFLPENLVTVIDNVDENFEPETIIREMRTKIPILITTDSTADLPAELLSKLNIPIVPYKVRMNEGVFYDGIETGNSAIIRSLEDGSVVAGSEEPTVQEYENFFSEQLTYAQHIIHISMGKHISKGYENACEAALAFYNVKVFDSGQLSSGTGLLVLYAKELAESGQYDPEMIVGELLKKQEKIKTSFVISTTDYLYRSGHLSSFINKLCNALMFHPVLITRNSYMKVYRLWAGGIERIKPKYIQSLFRNPSDIDKSILFITYAGIKLSEVEKIRDEVSRFIGFDRVYIQKASPSIAINCGIGSFGLIFARK